MKKVSIHNALSLVIGYREEVNGLKMKTEVVYQVSLKLTSFLPSELAGSR
jgi:hypothetical protein